MKLSLFKRVLKLCREPVAFYSFGSLIGVFVLCGPGWTSQNGLGYSKSPVISASPYTAFANGNAYLQQGIPLLLEYHALTVSEQRQRFAYPQRNLDFRSNFSAKSQASWHSLIDSVASLHFGIGGNLQAGMFTSFNDAYSDGVFPGGFVGVSASGFMDSLDFDVNAAFYVERHNHKNPPSVDRLETGWILWDNEDRNAINYKRFQGHLGFNYSWLRLELGHDALHWGPGFYNNLTLNRQAVPYGYFSIDLTFGPLRVISFYSSLEIDSVGSHIHAQGDRNLYGHRYELALGNATFGISEIQVIYNNNNAWLLVPVYPLFIEKGNYTERSNNGAISFDVNYRIKQTARIYSEFYIEDLDSPIALFRNKYVDSEWAWLAGIQLGHNFNLKTHKLETGAIFEYARVDQRVYTHYAPNESQIANAGFPLGNQLGSNSQSIDWSLYARLDGALFVGIRNHWFWKGTSYGSDLNGSWVPGAKKLKEFLRGAQMDYSMTPMLAYNTDRWQCSGAVTLFTEKKGELNFSVSL